jgi:hypothetical protein
MYLFCSIAGKAKTSEEVEDMLESGDPVIFTSNVSMYVDSARKNTDP